MQKKQALDCRWMATCEIIHFGRENGELGQDQASNFGKSFCCSKAYGGPTPG